MRHRVMQSSDIAEIAKWLIDLAKKWSRKWEEERVFEADADKSKPKFFITAAFMYPNGPCHMGHARTYLIPDILARFKRLEGYNVLFPMGFHYTGTPIIAMSEAIMHRDPKLIRLFSEVYEVPSEDIERMKDPLYLAQYFHRVSKEVMKLFGLSIDWRREFTTIDPEFKSFIHWQFRKLASKGYIERGSHPVGWCPRHGMPVGMHDTKGDIEPEIGEFVAILFRDENGIAYPAATLRPETIFGVTNVWINPQAQYVLIELENGDRWIVGKAAADRIKFQKRFKIVQEFNGSELIGKLVINPITNEKIPILPASFVDPSYATGVVMSVPAHAPYDAIALDDLKRNVGVRDRSIVERVRSIVPRTIIEVPGVKGGTAFEALAKYNIKSQQEREKLDEATKWVYSLELSSGRMVCTLHDMVPNMSDEMRSFVRNYISCKSVAEAREVMKKFLIERGLGELIYELLNKPVYCRCGTEVVVKVLENQWFINYGNSEWKKLAHELLSSLRIVPEEARAQFEATIDWLRRRACARTRGLGVPLPWDSNWVIESLSDSTIYMAFYTVIHKIRKYKIPIDRLSDEFWDYVLLGIGDVEKLAERLGVSVSILREIRDEFEYWYPLDWRVSGKDLIPNHLTFFIFNHAAIFPREKWPKGIIANGWVLIRQEKMSKSAGNIVPLFHVLREFGPDAVRLAIALGAEVHQDFNFDPDKVPEYMSLLRSIYNEVLQLYNQCLAKCGESDSIIDRWFWNAFLNYVYRVLDLVENVKLREAAVIVFYEIRNLIKRYLMLAEIYSCRLLEALKLWLALMHPFVPFITEELWSRTFKEGLLASYRLLLPSRESIDREILLAFRYAELIIESIENIRRAIKREKVNRVVLYVAPRDIQKVMKKVLVYVREGCRFPEILERIAKELAKDKKSIASTLRKLYEIAVNTPDDVKELYAAIETDEYDLLLQAAEYIKKSVGAEIEVYRCDDVAAPNLGGKKHVAQPLRPGIYVE